MADGGRSSGWQRDRQQSPPSGRQPPPPPPPPPGQSPPPPPPPAYSPPPPYGPQARKPTGVNPLAIVSLVAGIVWIFGLGSLAAIICGVIAIGQIRRRNQGGKGMAIAGIALGVVGVIGATLVIVLAAVVEEEVDKVNRDLRRGADRRFTAAARVNVRAEPGVCYTVTLNPAGSGGQAPREACGSSSYLLGTGSGRNAVISPRVNSRPGTITAWLTVAGTDQRSQTTQAPFGAPITLSP